MTLAARPDWADKYAGSAPDERFFTIDALMAAHDLDRARAIEVQNFFRDLTRADPGGDRQVQYADALARASNGQFEDGRDTAAIAEARFVVVFDLDETLYDQYFRDPAVGAQCHDFAVTNDGGEPRHVKLTPGWDTAIRRIAELGGAVVLFSANKDDTCWANAARWQLDGAPIAEHPAIAGLLTNSHLTVVPKSAGDPVPEPSKDLRIFDPQLRRTIIVDDNPRRLFQFRNVRVFQKFSADDYCTTDDPERRKLYEGALPAVVEEIEESLRYMDTHPGTDFAEAYLPYTVLGTIAVHWLMQDPGVTAAQARDQLRADPTLASEDF